MGETNCADGPAQQPGPVTWPRRTDQREREAGPQSQTLRSGTQVSARQASQVMGIEGGNRSVAGNGPGAVTTSPSSDN
jgi:hypothetical protein